MPPYSSTFGDEAADLSAAAGQVLDPWQRLVLCDILGYGSDGLWAAFETCTITQRQCGKGGIIEAIELAGLFLLEEQLILHSAHEYKTAQEAFLRIKALIDGCSDLSRHVKAIREANGEQQVILMSGARLRFVARSKGSGRGFSGQRNVLDEAFALTRTQLAALLPTMSAQPNPQMNLFSTVPDEETAPEEPEAVLPDVHRRAVGAAKSGRPGRLAYHDWSVQREELPKGDPVADRAVAERYLELAYSANPALGIRISEDYVRAELAALGAAKFGTERLGIWRADRSEQWRVITEADWTAAEDKDSAAVGRVAFSLDVNPERTAAALGVAGVRADGDLHVEVIDHRPGKPTWAVGRLVEVCRKWKPVAVVVDPAGAAGALIPDIEEALKPLGIELTKLTGRQVAAAYGKFRDGVSSEPDTEAPDYEPSIVADVDEAVADAVEVRRVRVRPHPALTLAVAGAAKRRVGDGTSWDRRSPSVDICPLVAATNAVFGFVTAPEPAPTSTVPLVAWR